MPDEKIISPARWYETQAELARAQEVAREAALAIAGLIGAAEGVLACVEPGRFERFRERVAEAKVALQRLNSVAATVRLWDEGPQPPTTVAELPDALRRGGGL